MLVDFKGGAAFGPCAELPHVVGLVTDLDDHLVVRALSSLRAELKRRERLFARLGAGDLEAYRRLSGPDDEAVPRLVVVVDELRALVDELPDFVTGLVRLAALGRSLGVHLVLATQRPSGAVSTEIQANVSLRIAFAFGIGPTRWTSSTTGPLPRSPPARRGGRCRAGRTVPWFRSRRRPWPRGAHATPAGLRVRASLPPGTAASSAATTGAEAETQAASAVVAVVRGAHRRVGGCPPRAPWQPPLPALVRPQLTATPGHATAIVVGLVDEPDLQRISTLGWRVAEGSWLVVGGSGTGRTTTLRALGLAVAASRAPTTVHLHGIDTHGSLADLDLLPHLGTRVGSDDPRACAALLRHLRDEVDRRLGAASRSSRTAGGVEWPTILLLVDGWEQIAEAQPTHPDDDTGGQLVRLLRDGRSVGLVGAVAGGRALLHPRWAGVGATTFLLGTIDPLDAALAGLRVTDSPREPPPGRAVRVHDRREVQFAGVTPADSSSVAATAGIRPAEGGAWRRVVLPPVIRRHELDRALQSVASGSNAMGPAVLVGLGPQGVPPVLAAPRATAGASSSPALHAPGAPTRCAFSPSHCAPQGGRSPSSRHGRVSPGGCRGPTMRRPRRPPRGRSARAAATGPTRPRGARRRRRPARRQSGASGPARAHRSRRARRRAGRGVDDHSRPRGPLPRARRRGVPVRVPAGARPRGPATRPAGRPSGRRHTPAPRSRPVRRPGRGHRGPGTPGRRVSRGGRGRRRRAAPRRPGRERARRRR